MADVLVSQADDQAWVGGEHFFDALHDPFCFTCGYGDENIIACKTCARCYHSECMYPPMEPNQVPEIWFCPVCVARNWHVPPVQNQLPAAKIAGSLPLSIPFQSGNIDVVEQYGNTNAADIIGLPNQKSATIAECSRITENATQSCKDTQAWKETERWKENSSYTPRGYLLDPSSGDKFIPLYGEGATIPLSEVEGCRPRSSDEVHSVEESTRHIQSHVGVASSIPSTSQSKPRRTGKLTGSESAPRKRYKYSDIPADVEKALDLIKNHLINVSQPRKSEVDVEDKAQVLAQKMKIQEGEMLICRQELQTVKQKLSIELSDAETLRAENADLRKEVQELRAMVRQKEDQMKNWQNMLRGVIGAEIGNAV
ncbi:hypothetical protein L207DRAFT_482494 [Hyaloscypha variabilis F]|uniref:PHD-type domain-containing protein n=1 Tax=Hyaloscypha variabilis (strain UAMH 11265 / GT02V1 / F) TaxID=1149755 RepID=A0A2J6RZF8_HYAVF|nr:hypothetical protein L207DRAFT_482494 [Hyaloscypha variabilis F]